jgi:hypothetical protein
MDNLADSLRRSPELFPHVLDAVGDTMKFVRLQRADYEAASFLDERVLTMRTEMSIVPWAEAADGIAAAGLEERCHFIFHIGHVGSTLLSRLLGAVPSVLSVREPLVLRTLSQVRDPTARVPWAEDGYAFEAHLCGCLKLLSRTFEAPQMAIVKATSFVSEMAAELLARRSSPKAILMYVSAESYLATIFGGPNSRREAALLAPSRWQRLQRRVGALPSTPAPVGEGETLAMSWACEMAGLVAAGVAGVAGERVLPLDFDRFLAEPARWLHAACRHLDLPTSAAELDALLAGPLMHRYSKGLEYAYDAGLRRDVLNHARHVHVLEIRRGLRWLDRLAASHATLGGVLAFAAGRTT